MTTATEVPVHELHLLAHGDHPHPHSLLGAHPARQGAPGVIVRAYHPDGVGAECILTDGTSLALRRAPVPGVFEAHFAGSQMPLDYRLRFHFADGSCWERDDPYRFMPTIGDMDLHLFNEGTHKRLWHCLGSHVRIIDGVRGVSFAVWAPNAGRVSVVGDFCRWDGRLFPMRQMGSSGVFELFIPGLSAAATYKYEIKTKEGRIRLKADPFAFLCECPPATASRVYESSYEWQDGEWMRARPSYDALRSPMTIYELHLGSWMRVPEEAHRHLTYREIAPKLVGHVKNLGFTHIELLPVAEHPYTRSWGYQVTGYYAPTARYGEPDDFRYLVDVCHHNGIGVILDWVPGHFPKDDHALRRFDGTCLYEHEDPRRGEHPDWGTLVFNYGRNEVRNFLLANALYWLQEFHIDGLRVDAVASMLYRDYSRREGEWVPNERGGREDFEAISFLQALNEAVRGDYPGRFTIAEESTAWPGVTRPAAEGGLGFTFKWNMGWMHDTLGYFAKNPIHRRYHQNDLTFAMLYEHTERFIMPLSHDEVVHGKGALLAKMPGDEWQRFANLRLLLAYQFTRPGKKLLFMGTELAPWNEWDANVSLDWHLRGDPLRACLLEFMSDLGRMYRESPALWKWDHDGAGFTWISCDDADNSVLAYLRSSGAQFYVIVLNMTPVPRDEYRIGALVSGEYKVILSTDDPRYGGSALNFPNSYHTDAIPYHNLPQSMAVQLPPLAALVLAPAS